MQLRPLVLPRFIVSFTPTIQLILKDWYRKGGKFDDACQRVVERIGNANLWAMLIGDVEFVLVGDASAPFIFLAGDGHTTLLSAEPTNREK